MSITFHESSTFGTVRFTLTASTERELQDELDLYLHRYHPGGYGTRITFEGPDPNSCGRFIARGTRFRSAD
jgi:hypothetical protein